MNAARVEILERVTAAVGHPAPAEPVLHEYRIRGTLDAEQRVALFCQRVGEYRAEVLRVDELGIADTVAAVCSAREAGRIVVPSGVPSAWLSAQLQIVDDEKLSPHELDAIDGSLTGCTVAIAETGTIILTSGQLEGRRALTLIPDLHVCVVRETQIVELVPEAFAVIAADELENRPLTFVSGPSATSDIELSRVEGVHGPRDLVVLVVKESP
jgi:L-lactate dehydrogenase complex protein LldG